MIDRFNNRVSVAWSEYELEWLRAALTLDKRERCAAYRDIASMSGRGLEAVRRAASTIRTTDARQKAAAERKVKMRLPAQWKALPSFIAPPSKARLMGARA